jgi:iron complex outermembrane receptor protein
VATLFTCAPASAQTSSGGQTAIEEVVVTARRREEKIQEVPVAVSAFTGEALERRSVSDINDLAAIAPGLQITSESRGTGYTKLNLRGQEANSGASTFDPAVGIYFAEVYVGRTAGSLLTSLQDVRSVEVLRGVQGTLFGRNSNGGAIVITPNAPDPTQVSGSFGISYGRFERTEYNAVLNVPVVEDKIAIRAMINRLERDDDQRSLTSGYGFGNRDRVSGRFSAQYDVNSDFYVNVMYDYSKIDEHGSMSVNPILLRPGQTFNQTLAGEIGIAEVEASGLTGRAVYQRDDFQVKGIVGFRAVKTFSTRDVDASAAPTVDTAAVNGTHQVSAELNASGVVLRDAAPFIRSIDWTAGLFGFHEYGYDNSFNPWTPTITLAGTRWKQVNIANRSRAVYGQGELHLTEQASIWGGARYTKDKRYVRAGTFNFNACVTVPGARVENCQIFNNKNNGFWSWNGGLRYQFTPNINTYVRVARGIRSGGLDNNTTVAFEPEKVTEYEAGLKADWLDHRLRTNIAVYSSDYKNIQKSTVIIINGGPVNTTSNAAKGKVRGFEFEGTAILGGGFSLAGTYSYTDAEYEEFLFRAANGVVSDYSDKDFQDTPKTTYSLSANFNREFEGFGGVDARVDYSWRSRVFMDISNSPLLEQPAYALVNARIGWTPLAAFGNLRPELAIWGKNLAGKKYNTAGVLNGAQPLVIRTDERRTIGVELKGRF